MSLSQIVIQLVLDTQQLATGAQQATTAVQNIASGSKAAFASIPGVTQEAASAYQNFARTVTSSNSTVGAAFNELGASSKSFFSSFMSSAGEAITMSLRFAALYVTVSGLKNSIGSAISDFIDLDTNLHNVQAITQESDASIAALRQTLITTVSSGQSFGATATELAKAMYDLVSAGYDTGTALDIAKVAAEGAAAGLGSTTDASKLLLSVLQAYHLPASDAKTVMDELTTTVKLGVLHFSDLTTTLGLVTPAAAQLGIPMTQLGAAIATLTREGQTPSRVMTNLNAVLTALVKPTTALKTELASLGYASGQAAIDGLGFSGLLQKISVDAGGSDAKLASWFANIRAIRAIFPLAANDGKDFTNMLAQVNDTMASGSETDKQYAENSKSISFQMKEMSAQFKAFIDEAGTKVAPVIASALGSIGQFVPTLATSLGNLIGLFGKLGGSAAAGGFGSLITSITNSSAAMTVLRDIIIVLVGSAVLGRVASLVTTITASFLDSTIAARLYYLAMGDLQLAFQGINPVMIAIIAGLAAVTLALGFFAGRSDFSHSLDGMSSAAKDFNAQMAAIDKAVSSGGLSQVAAQAAKAQDAMDALDKITSSFATGLDKVNSVGAIVTGTFQNLTGMLFHGESPTSNLQKVMDGLTKSAQDVIDKISQSNAPIQTQIADLQKLSETVQNQMMIDSGKPDQATENQALGLQKANDLIQKQIGLLQDAVNKTNAQAIAEGTTTQGIIDGNDALTTTITHLQDLAKNMSQYTAATKAIKEIVTPQDADLAASIANQQVIVDNAGAAAEIQKNSASDTHAALEQQKQDLSDQKDAIQGQLDALEQRRQELKDNYEASVQNTDDLKQQLDTIKQMEQEASSPLNPFQIPIDKLKATGDEKSKQYKDQLAALEAQSNHWEAQQKLQEDMAKQSKIQDLPALKQKAQALQDQITSIDDANKKAKDGYTAQDDALKKQEEPLKNNQKTIDEQIKQLDQRTTSEKDSNTPAQEYYQHQQDILKSLQDQKKAKDDQLAADAAKGAAAIVDQQAADGLGVSDAMRLALQQAITAEMLGQPDKIDAIAKANQVPVDQLQSLLDNSKALTDKPITPKVDSSSIDGVQKKLDGINGSILKPFLDVTGITGALDDLVAAIQRKATDAAKAVITTTTDVLKAFGSAKSTQGSAPDLSSIPGHADGAIVTQPSLARLAEGGLPEAVIPLTKPDRVTSLLAQIGSKFAPGGAAATAAADGIRSGASSSVANNQRSLYNYGTIVLDKRAQAETMDSDLILQRMVS